MRLAVISDVHGNLPALEAVVADVARRGADLVVNLGDMVSGPLWPRETLALLDTLAPPSVRGNHDRWLADADVASRSPVVAFTRDALADADVVRLAALPARLDLPEGILAVHGTPASDTEYLLEDSLDDRLTLATSEQISQRLAGVEASLVLCGHSHLQHSAMAGGRLVVNPGAVGGPRYAGNARPERNEAGSPHARYAIATLDRGCWSIEHLALAYDWNAVAARAVSVGFSDWGDAFLTHAAR